MPIDFEHGPFVIKGYAQAMADDSWGACCIISRYESGQVLEEMLPKDGPYFTSKDEAEKAGLDKGVTLLNERYPLEL